MPDGKGHLQRPPGGQAPDLDSHPGGNLARRPTAVIPAGIAGIQSGQGGGYSRRRAGDEGLSDYATIASDWVFGNAPLMATMATPAGFGRGVAMRLAAPAARAAGERLRRRE